MSEVQHGGASKGVRRGEREVVEYAVVHLTASTLAADLQMKAAANRACVFSTQKHERKYLIVQCTAFSYTHASFSCKLCGDFTHPSLARGCDLNPRGGESCCGMRGCCNCSGFTATSAGIVHRGNTDKGSPAHECRTRL